MTSEAWVAIALTLAIVVICAILIGGCQVPLR